MSVITIISTAEARARLMKIVRAEIGAREQGGNNRGKRIREYQGATWLEPDAWPWCAAFICWCILKWLQDPEVLAALGLTASQVEKWRPKTAGAFDLERWAQSLGLEVLGEEAEVREGDVVTFDFSHVAFVDRDAHKKSPVIYTVEGNTNGKGDRESTTGDGVWAKERARHLARKFIRLI